MSVAKNRMTLFQLQNPKTENETHYSVPSMAKAKPKVFQPKMNFSKLFVWDSLELNVVILLYIFEIAKGIKTLTDLRAMLYKS